MKNKILIMTRNPEMPTQVGFEAVEKGKSLYRFDGNVSIAFKTDGEAHEYSVTCHDERSAWMEKLIGGVWHDWSEQVYDWVNPAMGVKKAIEWAYPTSETAKQFCFDDEGCWCLTLWWNNGDERKCKSMSGHRLYANAGEESMRIVNDWTELHLSFHPKDKGFDFHAACKNDLNECLRLGKIGVDMKLKLESVNQKYNTLPVA